MSFNLKFQKYFSIIVIFSVSFILRFFYVSRNSWLAGDSYDYLSLAKSLALQSTYGFWNENLITSSAFRPPFYPFIVSLFWWSENAESLVLYLQVFLGSLTVLLTYFLAKKYFSEKVAVLSALLISIEPFTIHYTASVMSETLFTFLLILGFYLFSDKRYILTGLIFGLATLTRPVILPFLLLLVLISIIPAFSNYRKSFVTILLMTISIISIWTIRNAVVFKEFIPISTTGYGYNLLCGTLDVPMINDEGWSVVRNDPAIQKRRKNMANGMSEAKADRELFREATQRIISEPFRWLGVRAKQYTRLYIDSAPYILGKNNIPFEEAIQNGNWFFIIYKLLLVSRIFIFVGLGLFSTYLLRKRIVELLPFILFPIFLMLIHIPLWTENRYLLPMFPLVCIMASFTLITFYNSVVSNVVKFKSTFLFC